MKVVVCIKHLASPEVDSAGVADFQANGINPIDLNAIEESLLVAAAAGGEVAALTVGPPPADATLRKALMMGANRVYRLWDPRLKDADAHVTSWALALAA